MKRLLAVAALAALSSCGGDSSGPKDPYELNAGVYALQTVNTETLPATLITFDDGSRADITSGSATLRSDHSYTQTLVAKSYSSTGALTDTQSASENGTYTLVGTQITFTLDDNSFSYSGAVDRGTLSYTESGISLTFHK